ncbi:MAG TPA: SRPBCC family protein [Steroidobacteraceae bacterium]|nr:SRPBCC family protein [Steroidobacteraceae bacterium]
MYRAQTVSVSIAVDPKTVYTYASNPANLPAWAPGFIKSIAQQGTRWVAQTTIGEVTFRFAPPNDFGVLDHDVELPDATFHNPMRVVPNGTGSEVLFTLLQLPGTSDEQFQQDRETILSDLNRLRTVLEQQAGATPA